MSTPIAVAPKSKLSKPAPWWEIVIVMALYLAIRMIFPALEEILALPILIYMIIESWMRHRSWAENGFSIQNIPAGLRQTIGWFLLVAFGTQVLFLVCEKFLLPDVFSHIIARIPFDVSSPSVGLLITLAIATFLEELIFRALFQNRLSAFCPPAVAIGVVSLVFAIGHYNAGPPLVVFVDLLSVFIDSLIFGTIFQKSKNVFVSWIPHFLADVVALILILLMK